MITIRFPWSSLITLSISIDSKICTLIGSLGLVEFGFMMLLTSKLKVSSGGTVLRIETTPRTAFVTTVPSGSVPEYLLQEIAPK